MIARSCDFVVIKIGTDAVCARGKRTDDLPVHCDCFNRLIHSKRNWRKTSLSMSAFTSAPQGVMTKQGSVLTERCPRYTTQNKQSAKGVCMAEIFDKRVAVFFTGGTIGMRAEGKEGSVVPAIDLEQLVADLGQLPGSIMLQPHPWSDLPSPHMTPELMLQLARDVNAVLDDPAVSGVVVTHGTDIMEESAFMADVVLRSEKPVVFTGAMRSFGEPGYDGIRNLRSAILACAGSIPDNSGVLVGMADRFFAAGEVTKIHSMNINSFDAPGAGPLGLIVGEKIFIRRCPIRRFRCPTNSIEPGVDLISFCPGMDGHFIASAMDNGAKGLVVQGFGAGNVPLGVQEALAEAVGRGIVVVLTSRCIEGGVWPIYGYPGGAADLKRHGVIMGGDLPAQKARILLMAALGKGLDQASIRRLFEGGQTGMVLE